MVAPVTVKFEGLKELERKLGLLRAEFGPQAKTGGMVYRGLMAAMKNVETEAKRLAPRTDPRGMTINRALLAQLARTQAEGLLGTRDRLTRSIKLEAALKRIVSLIRRNIVSYPIPANSRLADGKPTVILRVRNKGYERVGNRIVFKNPGSSPGYWWWVEFGTSKFPARPFLRPAIANKQFVALKIYKLTVENEIAEFIKRERGFNPLRRAA